MSHRVVFVQGGGIGTDLERAVRRIIQAAGVNIDWQTVYAGRAAADRGLPALGSEVLDAIRETGVALNSKIQRQPNSVGPSLNVLLRRELGLFAAVRPVRNLPGLKARFENLDILLVREITEDLHGAIEHEIVPGVVQSLKIVTEAACVRFFRFVFELAVARHRKTVHCIHKANILKLADGLFLECFRRVAREYPSIQAKDLIVDNTCMQLVSKPSQFDVVAAGNLYGDLLGDLGAGLVGGVGATLGVNHGPDIRVYEAIHGGTIEQIGENRANPLPLLLPAIELLADLGETTAASKIRAAVGQVLLAGEVRTADLGGTATTDAMTDAIVAAL